jgi:predicted O-methyltransferase YrrM
MTTTAHKIRSAGFYLARPPFWAHFTHRSLNYLRPDLDSPERKRSAMAWAYNHAQSAGAVLSDLGLIAAAGDTLPRLPDRVIEEASDRVSRIPCAMGGPGDIQLIYAITRLTGARHLLETGVAHGWSSLAFLNAARDNGGGHLASTDRPYPGDNSAAYVGIAVDKALREHWTLVREPDRNGLHKAIAKLQGRVDVAHYDSDKTYRGRQFGYAVIWDALRPGGAFISDDIQDNLAFAHFVGAAGARFGVMETAGKFVGIAIKPRTGSA